MQEIMMVKGQIRGVYRSVRNDLSSAQVKIWSDTICNCLVKSEMFLKAKVIYFYYPLGNEVNLLKAAEEALRQGKIIGFPKTEGSEICFYQIESLDAFAEGCFHVMEPVSNRLLVVEKPLILIPGVVFDEQKNRMGYGKGFYDRYVLKVPEAVKIGIAYEAQIAQRIPTEHYDVPMDYILTEMRMW